MEFDDYEEANFDDEEAMMMEQQMAMEEEAALAMQMEEEAELANLVPTTPANNISLVPTNNLPLPPPTAMFGLAAAGTAVKFSTPTITDFKKTTNTQLEPKSPPRPSGKTGSLAHRIQAERMAIFGKELSANLTTPSQQAVNAFENRVRMHIWTPLYPTFQTKQLTDYLHESPVVSTSATGVDVICDETIVLSNGRRYFLHDRQPFDVSTASDSTSGDNQYLLGKSVFEIIADADQLRSKMDVKRKAYMKMRHSEDGDRDDGMNGEDDEEEETEEELMKQMVNLDEFERKLLQKRLDTLKERRIEKERREKERLKKASSGGDKDHHLWVDKYAPNTFTQLLSLEKTNREVLKALKRWDTFVFKRKDDENQSNNTKSVAGSSVTGSGAKDSNEGLDDDSRPKNKVIMLCGPPGTGKTTLAHICAKHAGYRVMEINASDDRSPEHLKEMLARATQSTTIDKDKRPNCIIFDEIDGMDGNKQALDMLIEVIKSPLKPPNTTNGGKTTSNKKSTSSSSTNSQTFALTRPLICICNDPYAPVLRELRKISEIFLFQLPQENRLVSRLKHICIQEHIPISTSSLNTVLTELVIATGHDIRSSINNLQFAALRMKESNHSNNSSTTSSSSIQYHDLSKVIESMMKMGLKDDQMDSFQIWQKVFVKDKETIETSYSRNRDNRSSTISSNGMQAFDAMVDHGDFSLLISGIHENMHKISVMNQSQSLSAQQDHFGGGIAGGSSGSGIMGRHSYSSDWLSFCDNVFNQVMSGSLVFAGNSQVSYQDGGVHVLNYVALIAPAVHFAHSLPSNTTSNNKHIKIEWPKKDRDCYYSKVSRDNILQSIQDTNPHGVWAVGKSCMVLDVVPYFLELIRPRVRPLPMISLSVEEQQMVRYVAAVMEHCGFSYSPTVVENNNFPNKYGGYGYQKRYPGSSNGSSGNNGKGSLGKDHSSLLLSEGRVIMKLDPDIELLVQYVDVIAQYSEEKKRLEGNTMGSTSSKYIPRVKYVRNHAPIHEDIKTLIYQEQRKYAIQYREAKVASAYTEDADDAMEMSTTISTPSKAIIGEKNKTPVSASGISSMNVPPAAVTPETVDKPSTFVPPGDAANKTGFNLENKVGGNLNSFFKRTAPTGDSNSSNKKTKPNPAAPTDSTTATARTAPKKDNNGVVFKFNQGFSNAVKRPVHITDFL